MQGVKSYAKMAHPRLRDADARWAVVQVVTAHVLLAVAAVAAATWPMLASTARTMRLERTSARKWSYQADSITSCLSASADAAARQKAGGSSAC